MLFPVFLWLVCVATGISAPEVVVHLYGAGASFPAEIYTIWMAAYKATRVQHVNLDMQYDARGSSYGKLTIKGLISDKSTVHYAGSDSLLVDEDYEEYPDLQMFPSVAGALVLAYNVPGVNSLVLSRDNIVGIYNGTITRWNHSSIAAVNPGVALPEEPICPIVRHDKSGTTEIFTQALSMFSSAWNDTYGTFNEGMDSDGVPLRWNASLVKLSGKRIYGVTDEIKAHEYSIGYTTSHLADYLNLPYAKVINKAGKVVEASIASVHSAMNDFSERMTSRMTTSIADAPGEESYPISGYTYFIVKKSGMLNCDSAVELVRYTEWFLLDNQARTETELVGYVPLSETIAQKIVNSILKTMTCDEENVYRKMMIAKEGEKPQFNSWKIPVGVITPLFAVSVLSLITYLSYQRYQYNALINKTAWNIPIEDIIFYMPKQNNKSKSTILNKQTQSQVTMNSSNSGTEYVNVGEVLHWPGKWNGHSIGLRVMELPDMMSVNKQAKKKLVWMKTSIIQTNVLRFYGLTQIEADRFVISEYCSKGVLNEILQDGRYNINTSFKFSLATDVAKGMAFLHSQNIVHANLKSSTCLIDDRWTVKVADWEFITLYTYLIDCHKDLKDKPKSPLLYMKKIYKPAEGKDFSFYDFWTAPEILRADYIYEPTPACDVYSFAVVLQEIFTRDNPYHDVTDTMPSAEVVNAIKLNNFRPTHGDDTPVRVRQIIEIAWSELPEMRPSFEQIHKMLRHANPQKKSVLDNMMEAMEEYTQHLEEKVEERTAELNAARRSVQDMLASLLPPHLSEMISYGQSVTPHRYEQASILVVELIRFHELSHLLTPQTVVNMLNEFCEAVDGCVARSEAHVAESGAGYYSFVNGTKMKNNSHHAGVVASLALDILDKVRSAKHYAVERTFSKEQMSALGSLIGMLDVKASLNGTVTSSFVSPSIAGAIHSGSLGLGVAGQKLPKFVLFGNVVRVAWQLLVHSEQSRVLVSEQTALLLKDLGGYETSEAAKVALNGSTSLEAHWLLGMTLPRQAASDDTEKDADISVPESSTSIKDCRVFIPPAPVLLQPSLFTRPKLTSDTFADFSPPISSFLHPTLPSTRNSDMSSSSQNTLPKLSTRSNTLTKISTASTLEIALSQPPDVDC